MHIDTDERIAKLERKVEALRAAHIEAWKVMLALSENLRSTFAFVQALQTIVMDKEANS